MNLDLLIVNPPSDEFYYIPVGSVAICCYLEAHGYSSRILNLSNYQADEVTRRLDEALKVYQPKRVGMILHWKELLHGFLAAGEYIRSKCPDTPIWAGGITSGYYARELLERATFLNGIIQGDAELPLLKLCAGTELNHVPNVYWSTPNGICQSSDGWVADSEFLNDLHYGRLNRIDDVDDYLRLLDQRLGVPLAPGRGCTFDCGFCGGSRSAFKLHSHRTRMGLRSPQRVVDDLGEAYDCGARNFLLSHESEVCERILVAIRQRFGAKLPFALNLEPWGIPSRQLLNKYAEFVWQEGNPQRYLLLSLRECTDETQIELENERVANLVDEVLQTDPQLSITVFSSYFTARHHSLEKLERELSLSVQYRDKYWGKNATFALMALSTDPASRWAQGDDGMASRLDLPHIAKATCDHRSVLNNMLCHRPRELTDADANDFLRTWHLDRTLEDQCPDVWRALVAVLPFDTYFRLLSSTAESLYFERDGRVYPLESRITPQSLRSLALRIVELEPEGLWPSELLSEFVTLWQMAIIASENRGTHRFASDQRLPAFLFLNTEAVYRTRYDFSQQINILRRPGSASLIGRTPERGKFVYLLLPAISTALPESELRLLEAFDGVTHIDVVTDRLCRQLNIPAIAVLDRISQLWMDGILLSPLSNL